LHHPRGDVGGLRRALLAAWPAGYPAGAAAAGAAAARALPPQCFYSVCSERQLMERLEFDLLFRWFVGLWMDEFVWDVSVF